MRKLLSKAELISAIIELSGNALSKDDVDLVITALPLAIHTALDLDLDVRIKNLGTFKIKETAARTGRNPRTGEALDIPAKRKVGFTASKGSPD